MNLGANRRNLAVLGGLVLLGSYLLYTNVLSGPSYSEPSRSSSTRARPAAGSVPPAGFDDTQSASRRPAPSSRLSEEFRPSLKPKRPEDRVDPMTIDPTLRLDLLAKVQAVNMEGGHRNLFQVGAAPLPPEPTVPVKTKTQVAMMGPQLPPEPPKPAPPPPPPPINLKYYGYSSVRGDNQKHAFFLDGDDILVAGEGETVKKRYRVVRIGVNSVVMEDTQFKHQQTLPLQQEAAG
ncbi:MAG TPA: hypothetical protein VMG35_14665 [Bryobacteraceae bacterium]|nr:hypothetical protein [Bryobacteraceae bacterium]